MKNLRMSVVFVAGLVVGLVVGLGMSVCLGKNYRVEKGAAGWVRYNVWTGSMWYSPDGSMWMRAGVF